MCYARSRPKKKNSQEENSKDDDANNDDEYNRPKDNDDNNNDGINNNNDDNDVNTNKERLDESKSDNTQQYSKRTREQVINDRYILAQQMTRQRINLTESGKKQNKKSQYTQRHNSKIHNI